MDNRITLKHFSNELIIIPFFVRFTGMLRNGFISGQIQNKRQVSTEHVNPATHFEILHTVIWKADK